MVICFLLVITATDSALRTHSPRAKRHDSLADRPAQRIPAYGVPFRDEIRKLAPSGGADHGGEVVAVADLVLHEGGDADERACQGAEDAGPVGDVDVLGLVCVARLGG